MLRKSVINKCENQLSYNENNKMLKDYWLLHLNRYELIKNGAFQKKVRNNSFYLRQISFYYDHYCFFFLIHNVQLKKKNIRT